jgi:hypothetical protein
MKKLILSMAVVAMLFSCSKDNVETETTADLTQMTPSKSLDQSSDGIYVGVFGHHSNRDLHGKIFINANNDGNYTAKIEMVNGNNIKFVGSSINKTNIHFTSNRGSFDFNTVDFTSPTASNVTVDNIADAYIVTVKAQNRMIPWILLGTYVQTGNEANFFGNWDLIGDGVETTEWGTNAQIIDQLIVTHRGTQNPRIENTFENLPDPNGCTGLPSPAALFDFTSTGDADSVLMGNQTTNFGELTNWQIGYFAGTYYNADCFSSQASGTWSRGARTGTITVEDPAPLQETSNRTNNSILTK